MSRNTAMSITNAFVDAEESDDYKSKVDVLMEALQRKCNQYVQLQMAHQNQAEHLAQVESSSDELRQKLKESQEEPNRKIRELEEKLRAAESLCSRLLESGRYWQKERKQQMGQAQAASKIVSRFREEEAKNEQANYSPILLLTRFTSPTWMYFSKLYVQLIVHNHVYVLALFT